MQEIWKDIPNYEGLYQVSNLGRVKSLERKVVNGIGTYRVVKERILKEGKHQFGYPYVNLSKFSKSKVLLVHQLVAVAFLGYVRKGLKGYVVDHINNICTDNRLENLQLISQRENNSKDKKGGTSKYTGVSKSSKNRWRAAIRINRKTINLGSFADEHQAHLAYQEALSNL